MADGDGDLAMEDVAAPAESITAIEATTQDFKKITAPPELDEANSGKFG